MGKPKILQSIDDINGQLSGMIKYIMDTVNVVTSIGLDNTGTNDCSALLQDYIDNHDNIKLFFPAGNYKFDTTVISNNKTIRIGAERGTTYIFTDSTNAIFKFNGGLVTITDIIFNVTNASRVDFTIYAINTSEVYCYNTVFTNNGNSQSGLRIENATISAVDHCKFNHSSISLMTWDCKITNTWIWALSQPFGIAINGGSGNITIIDVDVVPPLRSTSGAKAGIWINSIGGNITNNIIMNGIYLDGNPTLDTGIGLLCERVFAINLCNFRANLMNSNVVIIDTCYNVEITKGMFYNNNKLDQQAYEILVRKTYSDKHGSIRIDGNHFINYVTSGITIPTPAIKIDSTADGSTSIKNNFIGQQSNGYAYGSLEIDCGTTIPLDMYTNNGTNTVYYSTGSISVANGSSGLTLNLPRSMAYLPKQKNYRFWVENAYVPDIRVQQTNNYQAYLAFPSAMTNAFTLYYEIKL